MESISCEKDTILVLYPEKGPLIEKKYVGKTFTLYCTCFFTR